MKGRKELLEVLGINLGYVANNLLTIEWYDIVHRAYALGYVDGKEEEANKMHEYPTSHPANENCMSNPSSQQSAGPNSIEYETIQTIRQHRQESA